jgi:steroid delta-isomerase-like uncharacterized protein
MNRKLSIYSIVVALALVLILGACAPQPQAASSDPAAEIAAMEAKNLAIVKSFYDEFSAGNVEIILELHPDTLRMHYAGEAEDVETKLFYEDMAALKKGHPDLRAEVKEMIASGDLVFTELTWTTTHTGDYFGIPATGKTSIHNGIVVRRMENGLIVESWEMWDDLVWLQSIGYLPDWDTLIANGPMEATSAP